MNKYPHEAEQRQTQNGIHTIWDEIHKSKGVPSKTKIQNKYKTQGKKQHLGKKIVQCY